MDVDNSGSVSLDEFLTVMASEVDEEAEEKQSVQELCDSMCARGQLAPARALGRWARARAEWRWRTG